MNSGTARKIASLAVIIGLLSVSVAEAGTSRKELVRWLNAYNAKRIAKICHKRLGGYEKDVANFTRIESEARRAYTGKKDEDFARFYGGGWYPIERGTERALWKGFCRAKLSRLRWSVR